MVFDFTQIYHIAIHKQTKQTTSGRRGHTN